MKRLLLSKGWTVRRPGGAPEAVDLPHDGSVSLPRDPAAPGAADTGYFVSTDLCYSRVLRVPAEARHAILDLDGAYLCAAVTLNGSRLSMHPHGYAPWLVDLSAGIHPGGVDELRVDTSGLQPSTRWYSGSGLYRDAFLWLGGPVRIEPRATFVTTPEVSAERALVRVETRVAFDSPASAALRATLLDPAGEEVLRRDVPVAPALGETAAATALSFEVPRPDLWDIGHGALYALRLEVVGEGGAVLDEETTRFGIRSLSFDPEHGFRINGRLEKLRGGCIHHDHGVLGAAAFPAAERRRARLLQEAGFDAIRVAHNPPSLALLEACDELGMLLLDEAFDGLDPAVRSKMNNMLLDYAAQTECSVLISSHNLHEVSDICDKVALLNGQKIALECSVDEAGAGRCKFRLAFENEKTQADFSSFDIIKFKGDGRMITLSLRGDEEENEAKLRQMNPVLLEKFPLTLEEVFLEEMEGSDYDFTEIFS